MKSAKDMFEELGYSLKVDNNNLIEYSKKDCGHIAFDFDIETKRFYSRYSFSSSIKSTAHSITLDEFEAVQKQMEELGWIAKEEKAETNYEHFKDEIIENSGYCFALADGKPCQCSDVSCKDCGFSTGHGCSKKIKEWLKQPYKKQTYKLNKFEYDLIKAFDRCKECCLLNEIECLKKLREKGYFKGIDPFTKVHEILDNCEVIQ